ncbi:MAG: hypothetical protein ACRDCE_04640 [Cetobacterium sp.]|uniref:hypothetical protein n=1 Tax=Cetobacterium sp. TaxID=2071632 RepID=UPI003EE80774
MALGAKRGYCMASVYYELMDYYNKEQYENFLEFCENSEWWIDRLPEKARKQIKQIRHKLLEENK